jgi:hypothetical protein
MQYHKEMLQKRELAITYKVKLGEVQPILSQSGHFFVIRSYLD